MKNRKHRIFIIGNFVKTQALGEGKEGEEASPPKKREESKRRKLFKEVMTRRRESPEDKKAKYTYQLKQHIQADSLGSLFTCDLLGNNNQQPKRQKQLQRVEEKTVKPQQHIQAQKPPALNEEQHKESEIKLKAQQAHNDTFTGGLRRRIFEGIVPSEFRSQRCLSTLEGSKRRKIFFKYQSPNNLSINTSISKQRRRIFSLNHKPAPAPEPILAPLQSTIREQQQGRVMIQDSRLRG